MALSKSAATHLAARLQVIEAITSLILQELPASLGENVIENMAPSERKALRERMALYKSVIQTVRQKGTTAPAAADLTREEVGRLYFDVQSTMVRLGEANRKLRALGSDTFEDAPISPEQKVVWETKLTEALAALDAHVEGFPDEGKSGGGE